MHYEKDVVNSEFEMLFETEVKRKPLKQNLQHCNIFSNTLSMRLEVVCEYYKYELLSMEKHDIKFIIIE